MLGPEAAREHIVEKVFGIVEIHLDFFEDYLAFLLHVVGIKLRAKDEIGDDVEGNRKVLVEDFGIEADLFFRGECIEHAADRIHFAGDALGGAALRTLENHVLEKMSQAIFRGGFATGTVANPNADRDRADMLHGLGDDNESVRKDMAMDVACGRGHKTTIVA